MRESVAKGGPLDGTKVSAGQSWAGYVGVNAAGRYRWDTETLQWTWIEVERRGRTVGQPARSARLK